MESVSPSGEKKFGGEGETGGLAALVEQELSRVLLHLLQLLLPLLLLLLLLLPPPPPPPLIHLSLLCESPRFAVTPLASPDRLAAPLPCPLSLRLSQPRPEPAVPLEHMA